MEIDRFLLELVEALRGAPPSMGRQQLTDWLQKACEMIEDPQYFAQGAKGFTLLANRSKEHVSRELKKCLGKTPTQIVNQARMRYAADKLGHSSVSIIEIAMDCGFNSLSHFYKVFRAAYGIPRGSTDSWEVQRFRGRRVTAGPRASRPGAHINRPQEMVKPKQDHPLPPCIEPQFEKTGTGRARGA